MAFGKQIGDYSLTSRGMTVIDDTTFTENWEGTANLDGAPATVMASLEGDGDETGGEFELRVNLFLGDGSLLRSHTHGTYEATTPLKFRVRTIDRLSDGRTVAGEGEVDLAKRTWTGQVFEWT